MSTTRPPMTDRPTSDRPLAGKHAAVVNWRDPWHALAGGSEHYAWEYARALRDAGAQVDFVTARDGLQSRRDLVDGIRVIRRGGPFSFYLFAVLYYLTRRHRLDIVIDPECGIPSFAPLFVKRSTAVVLVVHHIHHDQFAAYFRRPLAWLGQTLEGRVMPRLYRNVRTVAVSESTREEMFRQLGWTRPIGLLANGSLTPAEDAVGSAAQKSPYRLVALGRLVPHKRVDLVIELVAKLLPERPELRLDVLGRGPEEARLRALIDSLGVENNVFIHGYVSEAEKAAILRDAGLHVCASDLEGWGQVVIEAAAFGVPTAARAVPGLRDSVVNGRTGWLADGAADARLAMDAVLRTAIEDLEHPLTVSRMYDECRARAGQFSWERMRREALAVVLEEISTNV